jgi:IS5 family transposase
MSWGPTSLGFAVRSCVTWHVAMRPCKRRALDKSDPLDRLTDQVEKAKAGIRSLVEHPFRVIKRQLGYCFDEKIQ